MPSPFTVPHLSQHVHVHVLGRADKRTQYAPCCVTVYRLTEPVQRYLHAQSPVLATTAAVLNTDVTADDFSVGTLQQFTVNQPVLWTYLSSHVLPLCSALAHVTSSSRDSIADDNQPLNACTVHDLTMLCFLAPNSLPYQEILENCLQILMHHKQWSALGHLLLTSPLFRDLQLPRIVYLCDQAALGVVQHFLCAHRRKRDQAQQEPGGASDVADVTEETLLTEHTVWRLVMRMSASAERSRLLLECLELWDAVTCVKHLLDYLSALDDSDVMWTLLQEKLTLMQVYLEASFIMHSYMCTLYIIISTT